MELIKQSSTAYPLLFLMVDSTDHITGKTGLSPTVTISKAGATFGSPAGAVTELSSGWYKVAGNATDTNTLGTLILHATATGADPCDLKFFVVSFDPQDAAALGLSRLDVAVSTRNSTAPDNTSIAAILTRTDVATSTRSTYAGADTSGTTTLLGRLTSARAGYLDTLNGIVAAIWAAVTDSSGVTTLLARLTSTRAGYLDNLSTAPPTLAAIRADLERNGGSLYNAGAAATAAANNAAAIIDTVGVPTVGTIAETIEAIDTGGGGASVEDIVGGMTTAGFAKIPDVQNTYDIPAQ